MKLLAISDQTLEMVIAALRYWQRHSENNEELNEWFSQFSSNEHEISLEDIDYICEGDAFSEHETLVVSLVMNSLKNKDITMAKATELTEIPEARLQHLLNSYV